MDLMKKFDDMEIKTEKINSDAVPEIYYEKDLGVYKLIIRLLLLQLHMMEE
jgi:hypothetical protein